MMLRTAAAARRGDVLPWVTRLESSQNAARRGLNAQPVPKQINEQKQ